jgi:hypothetical protein
MSSNVPLSSSLGHTDLAQTTFQVDPFSPRDFSKPHIHMHGCMWGNCTSSFSSLSELRDHVVLVHLESLPPTDSPPNHNISAQYGSQSSLDTPCLWSKCDNSYQPHSIFTSPQSLYTHLMKDHLQVWSPVDNRGQMSTPMEPVMQDTFDNMSPISHHGSTFAPVIPHATSDSTPETLASTEDSNSTHRCCWTGCSSYFSTCDELTTHIISDHIGSRKAQYDCFWEGCPRNGAQGFQSKQKICRHVQVLAFFVFLALADFLQSLIRDTDHSNVQSASKNFRKLQHYSNTSVDTHKRVSSACTRHLRFSHRWFFLLF